MLNFNSDVYYISMCEYPISHRKYVNMFLSMDIIVTPTRIIT